MLAFCFIFIYLNCGFISSLSAEPSWNNQDTYVPSISEIRLEGLQTVSQEVVYSVLSVSIGDPFSLLAINSDLKKLYYLGYFKDVDFDFKEMASGVVLIFRFQERQRLNSFIVEGEKIIDEKEIKKIFQIQSDMYFDYYDFYENIKKLRKRYQDKGFLEVDIQGCVESTSRKGYVDYVLSIDEDIRYEISSITICGVSKKDESYLREVMQTKTHIFILRDGYFKQSVFDQDKINIEAYFKDQGYLNCRIASSEVLRDDQTGKIEIIIDVDLGELFYVGAIDITGGDLFCELTLFNMLQVKEGEPFGYSKIVLSQKAIQEAYGDLGFVFCAVNIQTYIHEDEKLVDLAFDIDQKGEVYVYHLKVEGNTVTDSQVILRELDFGVLSRVDQKKLSRSRYGLESLDYFESIDFDFKPVELKDFYDVTVVVKEKKTGMFTFGGGYSTIDDFVGFIRLSQKNFNLMGPPFVGGGEKISLNIDVGRKRRNYYVDFIEPWFLGRPISMGLRVYDKYHDVSEYSGYDEKMRGFRVAFGHRFRHHSFSVALKWERIVIDVINYYSAPLTIRMDQGKYFVNTTTFSWKFFKKDRPFFPSHGYETRFSWSIVGGPLGGNLDIHKFNVVNEFYRSDPLFDGIFKLTLRASTLFPFAHSKVPIFQKYFLGGARTIRGYKERGVGPRVGGEPVGGRSLILGSLEYWYKINDMVRASLFCDAGSLWEADFLEYPGDLKIGVGFGIWVRTPIGPIRIDYGIPLDKDEYNRRNRIHFSAGNAF